MRDTEVFEGKQLSDLLKDIHDTTLEKREDIKGIIKTLTDLVKNPDDAMMLIPHIKDFFDVSVKNDDQMVKVATIVQRLISAESYQGGEGEGVILSDAEKDRLIANAFSDIKAQSAIVDDSLTEAKAHINV
jgi:hypothetical protein